MSVEKRRYYTRAEDRREYHRRRYLANRESILAEAARRKQEAKGREKQFHIRTHPHMTDPDQVADPRPLFERDRRESMEAIRLRLMWASSAGGDEGTVASAAVAVIRFAEGEGGHWTDRSLRTLHRRLSLAEGLTPERFERAREAIARELFVPL
jgi:hypothetical protein